MKYQRSVGNSGVDLLQPAEVEVDFSFVESVRRPDRHGKCVDVCFGNETCGVVCFSQELGRCAAFSVLSDVTQLSFNRHTSRMCELNHAPRQCAIISERHFGAVDHYGGVSLVNASRC